MPDDQRPDDAPSLEAPSLGRLLGRRKGKAADETAEPVAPAPTPAAAAPAPVATAPTPKAPRAPLSIDGRVAAGVTGLVVGLLIVLLTAGSLRLCESVRGVSTCGGGPGFTLLVAVMVAMVLLGGTLLRLARVPDPMSTSFLAVGLTCVLSLLFLVDVLQEWWMVIVIPVMTVATFLLSHWVTTSVIEPAEG
ncbi:MAG: hypothetical protein VX494_09315 [Actinomycetota bacterium]|nr:hypothetical protein [Actinomycetota bacterium]